jgi:hypothetical protein
MSIDLSQVVGTGSAGVANVSVGAQWYDLDPLPFAPGLTHGAVVTVNETTTYVCGGYVGGHPGPATDLCFVYEHGAPTGRQWRTFPSLPAPRSGGGMWYDRTADALVFANGASRPKPRNLIYTIDHNETWRYRFQDPVSGWTATGPCPYYGNHVGFTTIESTGVGRRGEQQQRHFLLGGQHGEDERYSNLDDMYEYNFTTNGWTRRRSLPFKRGHFSESTIPYRSCGIIIVAGAINATATTLSSFLSRTSDISYYDMTTDTWTSIGNLPYNVTTPVCTLHDKYLYCQTGFVNASLSVRRRIE